MNKEKIIKKLFRSSEAVDKVDESTFKEGFIDVSLEEFLEINGKDYYDKNKKVFYKKLGEKWFRLKDVELESEKKEEKKESTDVNEKFEQIYSWGNKLKQYVDEKESKQNEEIKNLSEKFNKLESEKEDFFKEIKDYIDLQIKELKSDLLSIAKLPNPVKNDHKRGRKKKVEENEEQEEESRDN